MSLTDRHSSLIISSPAFLSGAWLKDKETGSQTQDGFDDISLRWLRYSPSFLTLEDVAADFSMGYQLSARNFWCVGASAPVCLGGPVWETMVNYKGLASTKPIKVEYGGAAEQQQAGLTTIAGDGTYDKVQINENTATVKISYVSLNTATAPTDEIGTNKTPADSPAVRASTWISLVEFVYRFPNGWHLEDCQVDKIPGTTIGFVVESYKYTHAKAPV